MAAGLLSTIGIFREQGKRNSNLAEQWLGNKVLRNSFVGYGLHGGMSECEREPEL